MKAETAAQKFAKLMGLEEHVENSSFKKQELKSKAYRSPTDIGVEEADIQSYRRAEGLYYFLQAPALFTARVCKNCGDGFLVSRKNVAHCSASCVKKSLAKLGIEWTRYGEFEAMVKDVWNDNEPLIITHPEQIQAVLDRLKTATPMDTITEKESV